MAKRICCDVCYSYQVGPFRKLDNFVICSECFVKLKDCDDFMAEEHLNALEWDKPEYEKSEECDTLPDAVVFAAKHADTTRANSCTIEREDNVA